MINIKKVLNFLILSLPISNKIYIGGALRPNEIIKNQIKQIKHYVYDNIMKDGSAVLVGIREPTDNRIDIELNNSTIEINIPTPSEFNLKDILGITYIFTNIQDVFDKIQDGFNRELEYPTL